MAAAAAADDSEPNVEPRSQSDILTARVGDLLERWMYMQADPKKRGKPPKPWFHEGDVKAPVRQSTIAYLQRIRDQHAVRRAESA